MWRILLFSTGLIRNGRITSTCVENTQTVAKAEWLDEDHLHMCGEYQDQHHLNMHLPGSPPHVWRILSSIFSILESNRDHLHMCGEYTLHKRTKSIKIGSPPHVWRILFSENKDSGKYGITSTCVENTVNKSLYSAK